MGAIYGLAIAPTSRAPRAACLLHRPWSTPRAVVILNSSASNRNRKPDRVLHNQGYALHYLIAPRVIRGAVDGLAVAPTSRALRAACLLQRPWIAPRITIIPVTRATHWNRKAAQTLQNWGCTPPTQSRPGPSGASCTGQPSLRLYDPAP